MASLVPHAETTAANLARILRLHTLPSHRWEPHQRASAARRLLEELGVRCDESAALHDLKGFLLSSPRGTEMVVSRDLSDDERVEVYAHLIAHALLGPDGPELALAARRHTVWLDPKLVGGAIQASRTVGWRKLVPLLAVGLVAAGVGMEWFGRDKTDVESDEQDKLARAA